MSAVAPIHDDDVLEYAKNRRVELVESLLTDGKPPTDPKDRATYLQALDGLDRVAVAKKRIAGDSANANKMAEAAAMIGSVLSQVGNRNIYRADQPVERDVTPSSQSFVPELQLKPGELDIGIETVTYNEFAKKMQPD